ncbi:hypothetical protein I4U23_016178 [Adineta vaga]|nr:hypothetical protein I4U23_016178 [Adineta vaga]
MATNNTTTMVIPQITPPLSSTIFLYFYSPLLALSIACYFFIFYHIFVTPSIRRTPSNHVFIIMLIVCFLQAILSTSMHLDQFRRGFYWPPSLTYCLLLFMIDYIVYLNGALLMVWASLERLFFIFNANIFNTLRRRIIGHYLPIVFCTVYPLVYYTYFLLFYPCESYYDMSTLDCVAACFLWTNSFMALYELLVNGFAPVCFVPIFSILLLIRVLIKKQQMGRQVTWRKNRKMTIQLLGISTSFLLLNIEYFVLAIGQMVYDTNFGTEYMPWFWGVNVCTLQSIIPFLCLNIIPDVTKKFKILNPW